MRVTTAFNRLLRLPGASVIDVSFTAHTAAWHTLSTGEIYREPGPQVISERDAENARRRAIRQLERLGHTVTLAPLRDRPTSAVIF